jgi:REP element-mobilizing transposase RayT
MSNTYSSLYIHYIFSTKQRLPLIVTEMQDRLWSYIGGIARQNDMKALAVGGTSDHIHILLSLPATISVAKAIQIIKGNSSKWVSDTFPSSNAFSWQKGYGAFSVNISIVKDTTIRYIQNQTAHHHHKSFQDEYVDFLKKNEVNYDERYLWD